MTETIGLAVIIGLVMAAIWIYSKLIRRQGIVFHEDSVRESLSVRSHHLIAEGVKIDQMPYSWEKHEAHSRWVEKLYEYLDDYEAEVAQSLSKNSGSNIVAYAGIRICTPAKQESQI